jgi:heme exporter protein CcmD
MDLYSTHAAYVFASYGLSALVLGLMIAAVLGKDRRTRRLLTLAANRSSPGNNGNQTDDQAS